MASTSVANAALPDGDLLALLRERLNGEQRQMFVQSYAAYLEHDPRRDFVVPVDDALVRWLGYKRKDHVVRLIGKCLASGTDFAHEVSPTKGENPLGGRPTQDYLLTVHGFKQLCMAADTAKSREVREYYLAMEGVMLEHTRRKMAAACEAERSARALLESREAELAHEREAREAAAAELARLREKTYDPVPRDDHVYVCKERAELHSDRHKVGKAVDTRRRESQLNTGSAQGSKIVYERATHNAKIVEDIVGIACRRYWYRAEHYNCRMDHSIDIIDIASSVVDTLASSYEHMARTDLYAKVISALQADAGETRDVRGDVIDYAEADAADKDDVVDDSQQEPVEDVGNDDALVSEGFVFTRRHADCVLLSELKDFLVGKNMSYTKLKGELERLGAEPDRTCPTPDGKRGRGYRGVRLRESL
jgi:hypothetical protein